MTTRDVDVVVLGLGPGGEHAAIKLGRAGLDVVAVENRLVGGECPYYGCVPSKMMIAAAHEVAEVRRVPTSRHRAGAARLAEVAGQVRDEATDDWDDAVAVERLEDSGARFVRGHGRLDGPGRVEVDDTTYVARKGVVLNTGTAPAVPPIDGLADTPYWTNRDAVAADRAAGLGGGAGRRTDRLRVRPGLRPVRRRVTVVEVATGCCCDDEPEAAEVLEEAFAAEGIQVLTGVEVDSVAYADVAFTLHLDGRRCAPTSCWWPPGGAPTSRPSASRRSASTRTARSWRPTSGCAPGSGSGRSVTSPARARSPTCRCTRRPSWSATCSARTGRGPTTGPSPG